MDGLKSDLSVFVTDSVDLLNSQLLKENKRFFFDTVDVRQQVIGGKHVWDMFGWVVPERDVAEFEPLWESDKDSQLDGFDFVSVTWGESGGKPVATIEVE